MADGDGTGEREELSTSSFGAMRGSYARTALARPRLKVDHYLGIGLVLIALALFLPSARDTITLQTFPGASGPYLTYTFFVYAPPLASTLGLFFRSRPRLNGRYPYFEKMAQLWPATYAWMGIALAIDIETISEQWITRALGWDFTGIVHALEGDVVGHAQASIRATPLRNPLDVLFMAAYSYGYVFLMAGVPGAAFLAGERRLALRLLRALMMVWSVGLVFYVLVPVNEPWYDYATPINIMHELIPRTANSPHILDHLNNEFPSLHATLATAVSATLWFDRRREFWLLAPVGGLVVLSTMYLGIHWVVDVLAGVGLGLACAWAGVHGRWLRWPDPAKDEA